MLELVKPKLKELAFRQELLADEETMSYNAKWGGTIDFSLNRWEDWYRKWILYPDRKYYRYLYSSVDNTAVRLFEQCGFVEIWRNEDFIMLERTL